MTNELSESVEAIAGVLITDVHVVVGTTGQYAGFEEWLVCAYLDKHLAQEHAAEAQAMADAWMFNTTPREWNLFDTNMRTDGHKSRYSVLSIPLRISLPGGH